MAQRPSFSLLMAYSQTIADRDGGHICHYCWIPLANAESPGTGMATIDHKIPLSRGGSNRLENLVLCCEKCNVEKDDQSYKNFFAFKRKFRAQRKARRGIYLGAI